MTWALYLAQPGSRTLKFCWYLLELHGKLNILPSFRHFNWRIEVNNNDEKWRMCLLVSQRKPIYCASKKQKPSRWSLFPYLNTFNMEIEQKFPHLQFWENVAATVYWKFIAFPIKKKKRFFHLHHILSVFHFVYENEIMENHGK